MTVPRISGQEFLAQLGAHHAQDRASEMRARRCNVGNGTTVEIPVLLNQFWSRQQRAGCSLQRVAYREAFNGPLPGFFIERLSRVGELVYDGFMGRGTTLIEAAWNGRIPIGNDANPISKMIIEALLRPQPLGLWRFRMDWCEVRPALDKVPEAVFSVFHPQTLYDLCSVRQWLLECQQQGEFEEIHRWNRMLVLTSLAGARSGYLIGPSLHANTPMLPTRFWRPTAPSHCQLPRKELIDCLGRRSESLTATLDSWQVRGLEKVFPQSILLTGPAHSTAQLANNSVSLIVTGPPGLKPFNYVLENWLRCWFVDLDPASVQIPAHRELDAWCQEMAGVFVEFYRVLQPGGYCVIDLGRLRPRKIRWDEVILELMLLAGFTPVALLVNSTHYGKALFERPFVTRQAVFDEVLVTVKTE